MEAAKAFTIDRARWLRGVPDASPLMRADGCGCALGHYLVACGAPPSSLMGRTTPAAVYPMDDQRQWAPAWLFKRGSADGALQIMALNDGRFSFGEDGREEKLVEAFARRGVELAFVGEGSPGDSFQ